ncbi:putative bifunctional diguanylate cyclase/phosphodiesterase [Alkalimonas amylolytica]|uniref:Diguanylate cyclase (GGDEF) domain-containing protein n=1 Tax=Alkalimonas amylolytica TaxID=152573 RepID=A0A1H3XVH2_ALKAM|nr:EAL domain-containing protein [Alkalimonas amylolytica]SEA03465.1 diguanylate cyclase (GGDEF) domain-containing protein [Alkalimonas amylolytica]
MLSSLRHRLLLVIITLLGALALATALASLTAMKQDSQQQARQVLQVGANVFSQLLSDRTLQLGQSVQVLAADFGFRQAVATSESATIQSVLENHGSRIDAQLVLLLSPQGDLLASTRSELSEHQLSPLLQAAQQTSTSMLSTILPLTEQAYQLVLVPVRAPNIIAWVGMGFVLDDALAEQLKAITGLDISFVRHTAGQDIRLLTSTLNAQSEADWRADTMALADLTDEPSASQDQRYLTLSRPLEHAELWALLHLPNSRWLLNYQSMRSQLLGIFGVALTIALLVAFWLVRSITEPLQQLTNFARQLGEGKTTIDLPQARGEVGVLSNTLSQMQQRLAERERLLIEQAEQDALTGLYNRSAAECWLKDFAREHAGVLLLLNIRSFRHINDAFGLDTGDQLLQLLAGRIQQLSPTPLLSARVGGDEFLLVFAELPTALTELMAPLQAPYQLQQSSISLQLTLGYYRFTAHTAEPVVVSTLLRRVDIASANAKQLSEGIAGYQAGQDERHLRELTIIQDLPAALAADTLSICYQPKVSLRQQNCRAAEALIRWQHPSLGFIPPDEFIRLAEHTGHIELVTDWMLSKVIAQAALWQSSYPGLKLAVNLSPVDLIDEQLPARIQHLLDQARVPAKVLALEVTEGAVMQDPERVIRILRQLAELGIELAIDDFGTGHSSLAYLKLLPVHEVKIDRAFIKNIEHNSDDELIVEATSRLAKGLGFRVTAEGLENREGLAKLMTLGCDTVQGYYFAKPMPALDFERWLQQFQQTAVDYFSEDRA